MREKQIPGTGKKGLGRGGGRFVMMGWRWNTADTRLQRHNFFPVCIGRAADGGPFWGGGKQEGGVDGQDKTKNLTYIKRHGVRGKQ